MRRETPAKTGEPTRTIVYRSLGGARADWEQDLSHGRAFVNTRRSLQVGSTFRLVLSVQAPRFQAVVEGRVAEVRPVGNPLNAAPGMRVELVPGKPTARALEAFASLLATEPRKS